MWMPRLLTVPVTLVAATYSANTVLFKVGLLLRQADA
jgi:hypothetical protein